MERNIPDDAIALKDEAEVYSVDDEKVGNIERIFTDPGTNS
jgi:hypothetical protein